MPFVSLPSRPIPVLGEFSCHLQCQFRDGWPRVIHVPSCCRYHRLGICVSQSQVRVVRVSWSIGKTVGFPTCGYVSHVAGSSAIDVSAVPSFLSVVY